MAGPGRSHHSPHLQVGDPSGRGRDKNRTDHQLRGQHITGLLDNGDVIELPDGWNPGRRSKRVLNRTIGEWIQGRTSTGRTVQYIILIAFLVSFAIFALWVFNNMQDDGFPSFPGGMVPHLMTETLSAAGW